MDWKTNVVKQGGSTYLLIPPALVDYLGLEIGEEMATVRDEEGKKGKYASFWKQKK